MAGHARIRKLKQQDLAAEMRTGIKDAIGFLDCADDEKSVARVLQACSALTDALDCVSEASKRWQLFRRRMPQLRRLLARADDLSQRFGSARTAVSRLRKQLTGLDRGD